MLSHPPSPVGYAGLERRREDPLGDLGRQWDHICCQAVAPGEIMVALEAAGYNDEIARTRYGCLDLLECAEQLYLRVPYRPALLSARAPPPTPRAWLPLLRGLTYLLPAAWLPATANIWDAHAASTGWITATLFCWGWGQLIAYLAYSALGRLQPGQAAGFLRALSVIGLAITALLALLLSGLMQLPAYPTVATALLTATYVFSAYTLLILGRVVQLFALSLPAALLGLVLFLVPAGPLREYGSYALLTAAVSAPLGLALAATRDAARLLWPPLSSLAPGIGYALYGWSCAAFLAWATVTSVTGAPLKGLTSNLILVPLVLSMGAMEWLVERLLLKLRSIAEHALQLKRLVALGHQALFESLLWYGLILVGLHIVLAAAAADTVSRTHLTGQLLFGVAAMVSAILLAVGRLKLVVASWMVSLMLLVALNLLASWLDVTPAQIFLLDIATLLSGLLLSATVALRDINSYR